LTTFSIVIKLKLLNTSHNPRSIFMSGTPSNYQSIVSRGPATVEKFDTKRWYKDLDKADVVISILMLMVFVFILITGA
jgi:hypothetical protein